MAAYGYIRVSTAEQASNGDSLETQRNQIKAWATLKGLPEPRIFVEGGVSGSIPLAERTEGRRLIECISKDDIVITARLDRMFRSANDALNMLEDFKSLGVGLHMIDLGGDVCGNGISKLVFTILSAVAESERDRIRERIRDVKRHLASQGIYNGGKRPFGFDVVDGRLVENAAEQAVIARMKAMRADGKSFAAIGKAVAMDMKTVSRILDRVQRAAA